MTIRNKKESKEFIEQLKAISTPVIHGTQSRFLSSILKHGLNYELSSLHCEHKHNHFISKLMSYTTFRLWD